MPKQHTIKQPVYIQGVGLHSGREVNLTLKPAPVNMGVVFIRTDLKPSVKIPVNADSVQESVMCTTLVGGGQKIQTIEHLMAAFCACEIDNIFVELTSEEVPVMDGSSADFIFLLEAAGTTKQDAFRKFIRVMKPVRVEQDDKFAEFTPNPRRFGLHLTMDFPHPVIAATCQELNFPFTPSKFIKEISRARTFGQVSDLEKLHANNLALGASTDNAVGITEDGVINPEGLRFPDEFIRHKLLDAVGDLYVSGPIFGNFRGHKSGHALNNKLLRKLLADHSAWVWDE
jgi:UDP-3-O-[3-hydroxymyristoyl] N-acetylglucosamine deacetylase